MTTRIRLYETENDDPDKYEDSLTYEGKQAVLHIEHVIGDLVRWGISSDYNMRDFESLVMQKLQAEVARQIIIRRKKERVY